MNQSNLPCYEVIALKYATREGRRPDHFVGGDPHDVPMPMDYYLWVIRDGQRLVLVDTGFNQDMADKRHRTLLRRPADALKLLGIDTKEVPEIVITHLHNDHVGTFDEFPKAKFHLQEEHLQLILKPFCCPYTCYIIYSSLEIY
jgi:glyoxylase-like metal-dependent hydrolase (beta-lactamase superfamily II)